jgi:hypothetical protein
MNNEELNKEKNNSELSMVICEMTITDYICKCISI